MRIGLIDVDGHRFLNLSCPRYEDYDPKRG